MQIVEEFSISFLKPMPQGKVKKRNMLLSWVHQGRMILISGMKMTNYSLIWATTWMI